MSIRSDQPVSLAHEGADPRTSTIVFSHGNGFCKEIWRPVSARLSHGTSEATWSALDLRGHGDSPTGSSQAWSILASDVVGMVGHRAERRIGVGHSMGAAVLALAEVQAPGSFDDLVLIEPIMFPPPFAPRDIPLARAAERRRTTFDTRDEAIDRFSSGPFSEWVPDATDAYVDHAFGVVDGALQLKCAPGVEAESFREGHNHGLWETAGGIESRVTIVAGDLSPMYRTDQLGPLVERFSAPAVVVLAEVGHFVPMEMPAQVAEIISQALDGSLHR